MTTLLFTLGFFLLMALGMAVGVLAGRGPIKGSCGGMSAMSGEDSLTATRLNAVLKETSAAARALRVLAEAIETQPESLLSGRRTEGSAQ